MSEEKPRPLNHDTIVPMRQLAKMANVEMGLIRRMVLVLDVDDVPRLYTEMFLQQPTEELTPVDLKVEERPIVVNTTTMQNEHLKTSQPLEW